MSNCEWLGGCVNSQNPQGGGRALGGKWGGCDEKPTVVLAQADMSIYLSTVCECLVATSTRWVAAGDMCAGAFSHASPSTADAFSHASPSTFRPSCMPWQHTMHTSHSGLCSLVKRLMLMSLHLS